ncbi:hypothetical protein QR680_004393 [Steinernema hermaphroditum]|uniref:lipoyl(octanoyl) transferase n=1 Tax=Steinernema hermaphroditum TaxID=289476 RepID=A0AA39LTM6_9BILA|nr:hypothetical protein QR680_004393 [Steinernema hermaphroditum]
MRLSGGNLRPALKAVWLGRVSYDDGLALQKKLVEKISQAKVTRQPIDNVLLLLEHSPVFTVGIRERLYTAEEERLRATGADFCRTNRGGLITFHGPGQLVAYPIVDLASLTVAPTAEFPTRRVGVRRFVHLVEETLIDLLKTKHGFLTAGRSPDTGVWLDEGDRKIAAIGLSIRRGISSHGLALNCNTDLKWFDEASGAYGASCDRSLFRSSPVGSKGRASRRYRRNSPKTSPLKRISFRSARFSGGISRLMSTQLS